MNMSERDEFQKSGEESASLVEDLEAGERDVRNGFAHRSLGRDGDLGGLALFADEDHIGVILLFGFGEIATVKEELEHGGAARSWSAKGPRRIVPGPRTYNRRSERYRACPTGLPSMYALYQIPQCSSTPW